MAVRTSGSRTRGMAEQMGLVVIPYGRNNGRMDTVEWIVICWLFVDKQTINKNLPPPINEHTMTRSMVS